MLINRIDEQQAIVFFQRFMSLERRMPPKRCMPIIFCSGFTFTSFPFGGSRFFFTAGFNLAANDGCN